MDKETEDRLYRDLVKLGDMMGDGLHLEPDGKWINKEYKATMKALGLWPKQTRRNNSAQINEKMAEALKDSECPVCTGELKQTRSGSMKAKCTNCTEVFKVLHRK